MPNWVNNKLAVKGPAKYIEQWKWRIGTAKDEDNGKTYYQILKSVYPPPKEEQALPGNWQEKHWGCQWGDYQTEIDAISPGLENNTYGDNDEEVYIRYRFVTDWDAPIIAFEQISKMFPGLQFHLKYADFAHQAKGEAKYHNGEFEVWVLDYEPEWDDKF